MSPPFESVLVANRGEIALRIIKTLRLLGVRSVAVYAEDDRLAPHVRSADEAIPIGSYLDVEEVVAAATESGCQALHPGYGFLSENPKLARACEEAGVAFVGPPAAAIEIMGDKISAKAAASAAGVAVIEGSTEHGLSDEELAATAGRIGFPVLVKPSAGGGGKGMHRVDRPSELPSAVASARREAIAAFGDGTLMVERFVARARHVEVQVLADSHGVVASLGERDCSLQRRHQKLVEESPSTLLDDAARSAMGQSAVSVARACGYVGAGTVEFIVDAESPREHCFMEMNTRLQVEHPVTEAVTGLDLVEWQLRITAGERLPWDRPSRWPRPRGHAIEARVYAEDPRRGFLPSAGQVLRLREPSDLPGVRVDSGVTEGVEVSTRYDPLLAKLTAWGENREEALARLGCALASTVVLGVATNAGFLRRLLAHPEVSSGGYDTGTVERLHPELLGDPAPAEVAAAAALLEVALSERSGPAADPWQRRDGWRLTGPAPQVSVWRLGGDEVEASVIVRGAGLATVLAGERPAAQARYGFEDGDLVVEAGGARRRYSWAASGTEVWLGSGGDAWSLSKRMGAFERAGTALAGEGPVTSPMPGTVLVVHVSPGEAVVAGQPLVTVEAMKIEHVVAAATEGTVAQVLVKPGDPVRLDEVLAVVKTGAAS